MPTISASSPYGKVALGDRKPAIPRFTVEAAADCHAQFGSDVFSLLDQVGGGCFEPLAVDGSPGTPIFRPNSLVTADSIFTSSVSSGVMTVTGSVTGRALGSGMVVSGSGLTRGATIQSQLTGTPGGAGTYQLSTNDTASASERWATSTYSGLMCPWTDQANQTTVVVFANPNIQMNAYILGDYITGDTAAGWYLRTATNGFTQRCAPGDQSASITLPSRGNGSWLCLVITEDAASVRVKSGNLATSASPVARVSSGRRRSIGNRALTDLTYQTGLEVAEVVHIPATVDEAEMVNLYNRAKARAALRGIAVL
ncbi:hypothetical protein [Novosphingobium sp.]|uniref:hypothetical protein n=1 Tax=Novosphingobium sp. TaxID=1874826 RepID=UPI002FDE5493